MAEQLDVTLNEESPASMVSDGMKKNKLLILIPVIVLALGIQAVAAYYTVSFLFFRHPPAKMENAGIGESDSAMQNTTEVPKEKIKSAGEIFEFADLIVNPAGTMGRRYFVISMGFEVSNKKVMEEITLREAPIRDALITLLAQKELDYLADAVNMETIRSEIQTTVNKFLETGQIVKIYFTGYILQ